MFLAALAIVVLLYVGYILKAHGLRRAAVTFAKNGPAFMARNRAKFGDVFTTMFAGYRTTFIADYRDIPTIWKLKDAFDFSPIADQLGARAFGMRADMIAKYDPHEIHRQYTKYLMGDGLKELTESFWRVLMPIMNRVPAGEWQSSDLFSFVRPPLLEASTVAMNGQAVWSDKFETNFEVYDKVMPTFTMGIPHWLLQKGQQALHFMNKSIPTNENSSDMSPVISERLKHFYSVGFPPEEAQRHVFAFVWASNANVIPGSFWFLYYVMRNPEALAAAREEIDLVMKAAAARKNVSVEDVVLERDDFVAMKKIESMINETLRYKMSIISLRLVQQDCDVSLASGDVRFRKGDRVLMFPPEMHHDPEVYPEPHVWKWDRYYSPPGTPTKKFYKNGKELAQPLLPFGGGYNICPGRFFALNEYKLFVVAVLRYFDIEILDHKQPVSQDETRIGNGVFQPTSQVPIRFRRRVTA